VPSPFRILENYVIESVGHRVQALDNSLSRCECLDQTETHAAGLDTSFGINTKNAIGALSHCAPEPQSLLDALKPKEQNDMVETHRKYLVPVELVSHHTFNEKTSEEGEGYCSLPEDTVERLHLDGLDVVHCWSSNGPDGTTLTLPEELREGWSQWKVIRIVEPLMTVQQGSNHGRKCWALTLLNLR
jgi:hypothetical protein